MLTVEPGDNSWFKRLRGVGGGGENLTYGHDADILTFLRNKESPKKQGLQGTDVSLVWFTQFIFRQVRRKSVTATMPNYSEKNNSQYK
jgi:hypothetical protein